jgi:drug/metabolite transporter (DMT)-like permease
MITFDNQQVSWLGLTGVIFDIAGAIILSRSFIWARPRDIGNQAIGLSWVGNTGLLKALAEQKIDARWGAGLLVAGFILQAASSAGLKLQHPWEVAPGALLVVAVIVYMLRRDHFVRKVYDNSTAAADDVSIEDQRIIRDSFGDKTRPNPCDALRP